MRSGHGSHGRSRSRRWQTIPQAARIALVALLAMLLLVPTTALSALWNRADASSGYLQETGSIPYDITVMTDFTVDGVQAYCAWPIKPAPDEGAHNKVAAYTIKNGDAQNPVERLYKAVYYSYGGPGFDASMWPSKWYDGTAMSSERYVALSHVLISEVFTCNFDIATEVNTQSFRDWLSGSVIGWKNGVWHPESTQARIYDSPIPEDFGDTVFAIYQDEATQPIISYTPGGWIKLKKESANPDMTEGNPSYSLKSAVYGVYRNKECTDKAYELTTDSNGESGKSGYLAPATYYVREISAPKGYKVDTSTYKVKVTAGTFTVNVDNGGKLDEEPVGSKTFIKVSKFDGERNWDGTNLPQGSASLEGARYEILYYAGSFRTAESAKASGEPFRSWTFKTDSNGCIDTCSESQKTGGDPLFKDRGGNVIYPIGTYLISEKSAPKGYLRSNAVHLARIIDDGTGKAIVEGDIAVHDSNTYVEDAEQVARGSVVLEKIDSERGKAEPQGDATLAGIGFQIINRSEQGVHVLGSDFAPGKIVATITTDENGSAKLPDKALPYGTYEIRESAANGSYTLSDEKPRTFKISEDGHVEEFKGKNAFKDTVARGTIRVQKTDVETGEPVAQGDATFEGTTFTVKSLCKAPVMVDGRMYSKGEIVARMLAKADGSASLAARALPYGRYEVQEIQASEGYRLTDGNPKEVIIDEDGEVECLDGSRAFANEAIRGSLELEKRDRETHRTVPQGDASLKDIIFEVRNDSAKPVMVNGCKYGKGDVVATLATDEKGYAALPARTLPYGTYTVYEVSANDSYLLSEGNEHTFSIREEGYVESCMHERAFSDEVMRGDVRIEKRDRESWQKMGLGDANLDGTTFEITNRSTQSIRVDGVDYAPGETCATLSIKDGEAYTEGRLLPFGTYSIREIAVGEGYLLTDGEPREFSIRHDGDVSEFTEGDSFANQVRRGDLELVKVRESDMAHLAGVPFKLTSKTTGESHVLVTDANGEAKTSALWNKHTSKTNANDKVAEGEYDDEAGIWFGAYGTDSMVEPDDALGALPYDIYVLEEIRCKANEGCALVRIDNITVRRDGVSVNEGTIVDNVSSAPFISTVASDAHDSDKTLLLSEDAQINDHVAYSNLDPEKTYRLDATLVNPETEEPIPGMRGSVEFTPKKASGSVEVTIPCDTFLASSNKVVVFEELTLDGMTVAEHKDAGDSQQTVKITTPKIATTAVDARDLDKVISADAGSAITDTVSFSDLFPGKEYTVEGTVMIRPKDAGTQAQPYVDSAGRQVGAATSFIPSEPNGSVSLTFELDASGLEEGTELVVFERLLYGQMELASHQDPSDDAQTVGVEAPRITTSAVDAADSDKLVSGSPVSSIVDTVVFSGLNAGREYRLVGTLMSKSEDADGNVIAEPFDDADGEPISSSISFTPDSSNGSMDVVFEFSSSALEEGQRLVAFEKLYNETGELAAHDDPSYEGQTVEIVRPKLKTTASDESDGEKELASTANACVVDVVAYEDVTPGAEYEIEGSIMVKRSEDGNVWCEPLADINGNPVTGTTSFKASSSSGNAEVRFAFDTTSLENGTELVAYERLIEGGEAIAWHEDPSDAAQTVTVIAGSISTEAVDSQDGDHQLKGGETAHVVDTVRFEGLSAGTEYKIKGVLMNKDTGKELICEGTKVQAEATFVPEQESGFINVEFTFETVGLADDMGIVAFEELYQGDSLIATHKDISDEKQTVWIGGEPKAADAKVGSVGNLSKTGDGLGYLASIAAVTAIASCLAGALALRRLACRSKGRHAMH